MTTCIKHYQQEIVLLALLQTGRWAQLSVSHLVCLQAAKPRNKRRVTVLAAKTCSLMHCTWATTLQICFHSHLLHCQSCQQKQDILTEIQPLQSHADHLQQHMLSQGKPTVVMLRHASYFTKQFNTLPPHYLLLAQPIIPVCQVDKMLDKKIK